MGLNMTLLGQMITFLIFVALTAKFVWPKLSASLEERRKKIADGLAASEKGKKALEAAEFQAREMIREAKEKAAVIVEQATQRAHGIEEEAREDARKICDRMKKAAESEIEQAYIKAKSDLTAELANLVSLGVEKVIDSKFEVSNDDALIQKVIAEVGA